MEKIQFQVCKKKMKSWIWKLAEEKRKWKGVWTGCEVEKKSYETLCIANTFAVKTGRFLFYLWWAHPLLYSSHSVLSCLHSVPCFTASFWWSAHLCSVNFFFLVGERTCTCIILILALWLSRCRTVSTCNSSLRSQASRVCKSDWRIQSDFIRRKWSLQASSSSQ